MPLYDLSCDVCGLEYEAVMPSNARPGPCPQCSNPNPTRRFPMQKVAKVAGPKGLIFDERQVFDTHGENWRNPHNHTREGGDRKAMYWY